MATRSLELFQLTVAVVETGICEKPISPMKLVFTVADASTVKVNPACPWPYVAVT